MGGSVSPGVPVGTTPKNSPLVPVAVTNPSPVDVGAICTTALGSSNPRTPSNAPKSNAMPEDDDSSLLADSVGADASPEVDEGRVRPATSAGRNAARRTSLAISRVGSGSLLESVAIDERGKADTTGQMPACGESN